MGDSFQGTSTLQPFAPRWTDPDLLEKILVGRRALVDKLEQLAIEGAGGPNKYQRLIIGPRGSGKTHVLKVLHTRLMRNQALKDRLLIVYLLEDELGVASFRDFMVRLLRAIQAWYPDQKEIARGLEDLYDLPPAGQQGRAVELLLAAAGDRDVLIIMENLGITFDQKQGFGRKGQQAFRDMVQQYPRFMVFASAQGLLDGVSEPNAPFYEFFQITHLQKLTLDEAVELLTAVATGYGKPEVVKLLGTGEGRARVRAIYSFTGGNHRLLVTFYEFLAVDSVAKLSEAFVEALQPLKPYYQEQMRSLSAQQQKIVQYLSVARTPMTVKEIARGCLATSNTVSSQMKALLDRGFVARIPQGRESYYEITETLFRICYEADLDHQGAPIRLFVDFLGNFYTAQELDTRARGFLLLGHQAEAALYQKVLLQYHPDHRLNGLQATANLQDEWKRFFRDLAERAGYDEIISFAKRLGESKDASIAVIEAEAYVHRENLGEACAVLRNAVGKNPESADLKVRLGWLLFLTGDGDGAETHCRRALELDPANAEARQALVTVLAGRGQVSEALQQYQTVLVNGSEAPDAASLTYLGFLHNRLGHAAESEDAWRRAVVSDPSYVAARLSLGAQLATSGRFDEALEQAESAMRLQPGETEPRRWAALILVALVQSLSEVGDYEQAERHLRRAVQLGATQTYTWVTLARLLSQTGRYGEALEILSAAVERADKGLIWKVRAELEAEADDLAAAATHYQAALEEKPDDAPARFGLSAVLLRRGMTSEAIDAMKKAIEASDDSALAAGIHWNLMALFSFCTRPQSTTFLEAVLDLLLQRSRIGAFERALSLAVFGFLEEHESRSEERFADVSWVLENLVARYVNVAVAALFLTVGVDYLKRGDTKALMRLSREERALFTKELGIDATL